MRGMAGQEIGPCEWRGAGGQPHDACAERVSTGAVQLSSPVLVPIGDFLSFFAFSLFFPPSHSLSCFFVTERGDH